MYIQNNKRLEDYKSTFLILILTSSFISTGFMLLKDIFIVTSITLSFYASLNMLNKKNLMTSYVLLILSILIMSLFRVTYIWAPPLIFLIINIKKNKLFKYALFAILLSVGHCRDPSYNDRILFSNETLDIISNDIVSNNSMKVDQALLLNFLLVMKIGGIARK